MKVSYKTLYLRMAAGLLAVSFAVCAHAETPREELVHAYRLLKLADHDYDGHRVTAMKDLEAAGKKLDLVLEGDGEKSEQQWKSDKRLTEARRLLREARKKLEDKDRERAAADVDAAVKELNLALKVK
jgi:hypothetical protein